MPLYIYDVTAVEDSGEDEEEEEEEDTQLTLDELYLHCKNTMGDNVIAGGGVVVAGFPRLGMADSMGTGPLYYNHYLSSRQFKKSLNSSVVSAVRLDSSEGVAVPLETHALGTYHEDSMLSLEQILNKEYAPVDKSYEELMSLRANSLALSHGFGLIASEWSKFPILLHETAVIGEVREGKGYIHTQYAPLLEEYYEDVSNEVTIYA